MRVYMTVSEKHNMPVSEVIRGKFDPEIQLYIRYYNHLFQAEQEEYEEMKAEQERQLGEVNNA